MDQARATLERTAHIRVERRIHDDDDDGMLTAWSRGMPKKEPPLSADEVRQMIADAKADVLAKIDGLIDAGFEARSWQQDGLLDGIAKVIAEVRAELRKEIADIEISKAHTGDQAKVIDLPALPLRGARRA